LYALSLAGILLIECCAVSRIGRTKARLHVAKIHQKISDIRRDDLH
jgi:hypothetical protein